MSQKSSRRLAANGAKNTYREIIYLRPGRESTHRGHLASRILEASERVEDGNVRGLAKLRASIAVRYIGNIRTPASAEYL